MFLLETINLKSVTTGFQHVLKSGAFVSFTVGKRMRAGIYTVAILGKSVTVRASESLVPGSVLRAKVAWIDGRLQLNIVKNDKEPVESFFERTADFSDKTNKIVAESLIRSGMPLLQEYFSGIKQALKGKNRSDIRLARILVLLMDKGIPLSEQNVSEILMLMGGEERGNPEKRDKNKTEADKLLDKDEIKEDLKKKIGKIDLGNELLKYFNHRIAGHDNWLIIPLSFNFKRKGKGVLKLRMDKKYNITNMVLTFYDGTDWEFNMVKNGKGSTISVNSSMDDLWKKSRAFEELKEKLYKKDIYFDDINTKPVTTDGFSKTAEVISRGVDFTV